MRAVITTIGGTVIDLDDSDIIKDTVYVTNQCTNGNEYEYGCVYAAECGITIKSDANRYSLYNAKLELFWSLFTGLDYEEIPLGVFYISEPNRINDKISIKALDGMTKLDVNVDEDTQGTMPQLLSYISEKCGVELAQSESELSNFVNSNVQYSVYSDTVETYRDLLSYVCMMSAAFATFDKSGKLKIVSYATEKSVVLSKKHRFQNATFSDYETSFSGIKARFIAEENYAPYEEGDESGLVLDLGDNPIVRGLPETKHTILQAVFDILKTVSYTPFELETFGNPAIELGDMIQNEDVGKERREYLSPVTYFYWTYRGKHKLRGVGGNPLLCKVNNKQGKQINSLENEIQAKNVTVKNYTNADVITFTDAETEIATFNYAATENSKIIFLMTVRLSLSLDGLLVIKFYTDGAADNTRVFRKYLERGEHFVTISEIYTAETNDRHTINIKAHIEYFESDSRKQDADIKTCNNFLNAIANTSTTVADNVVTFPGYEKGVIDTTIATATIEKGGVNALFYGQGIAEEGKWDGAIMISEIVNKSFAFDNSLVFDKAISEVISENRQIPTPIVLSESVPSAPFAGNLVFGNVNEYVNVGEVILNYIFSTESAALYTYDEYITTNNDMFALKTIYNFESVEEEIDSGKMCSIALDYTGITVESVVVENG